MISYIRRFIRKRIENRIKRLEREKAALREETRKSLIELFAIFEQLSESRLVFIDTPNRRVLVSDMLCSIWAEDKEKWHKFFQRLGLWVQYKIGLEYWNARRLRLEATALRDARKVYPNLTKEEERIIRQKAWESLADEAGEPIRDEYEFCICDGILRHDTQAEAVGVWKNGELTMKVEI